MAGEVGQRPLVITGRSPERARPLLASLEAAGLSIEIVATDGEPTVAAVTAGAARARAHRADVLVAVGGGSALDAGKAIAAMAANDGDLFDYLETIGHGRPLEGPALPTIAVPTTAGTGSEATRNAVVFSPGHRVKVSLRHVSMIPRVAIVDPRLSMGLPPVTTAATGLDALTQLIEPYVSHRHNPVVDALALDGMARVVGNLRVAVQEPGNLAARSEMALAALWSGMSLANAALGAVHGLAGPLGGLLGAPHGALCAALLPHVMAGNIAALRRAGGADGLERYDRVAQVLTGSRDAGADDGVSWVRELARDLTIPGLATHGLAAAAIPAVIEPAQRASSMKGNPIELPPATLAAILEAAL